MKPFRKGLELKRRFALVISALFLVFLAASQPHRVHHLFEGFGHAHDQGEVDSKHNDHSKRPEKSAQPDCVAQAVSQHCSAIPVAIVKIPIIATTGKVHHPVLSRWIYHFISSPFSQRAPPAISSSFGI
jgi:hypothetical protein